MFYRKIGHLYLLLMETMYIRILALLGEHSISLQIQKFPS